MRFLVVEADRPTRSTLQAVCSSLGSCDSVAQLEKGVRQALQAYDAGHPYQCIVLEVPERVPERDEAHQAVQLIRRAEYQLDLPARQCARILMTTSACEVDLIVESLGVGCQGYLLKPFDQREVLEKFEGLEWAQLTTVPTLAS